MRNFNIIPAIDLMGGKCVRLTQGDYGKQKTYSEDPVSMAKSFEAAGAKILHLVDLDGAKSSCPQNLQVLKSIASQTSLKIEFGGGVKTEESLKMALEAGADWVICGSIAVSDPEAFLSWTRKYPGKIILGLDLKNGRVATNGWLNTSSMSAVEVLTAFGGSVTKAIVTEISRDGMLQGVNLELYAALQQQFPDIEIVVSGGISGYEDFEELRKAGLKSAVVGKAIYEGRVRIEDLFRD